MRGPDVVVIGGGIAGVSVAAELAADHSVVLVEAESELGTHATGRSAATYLQSYGPVVVRRLTMASGIDYWALGHSLERPVLTARPLLWIADAPRVAALEAVVAERRGEGLVVVSPDDAADLCPALRRDRIVGAALDRSGHDIDVGAVLSAYVARLRSLGGVVHRGAAVREIRRNGSGWTLTAGTRTIHAGAIVNAAGAWADAVAGMAGVQPLGLQPRRRSVFLTTPPAGARPRRWPMVMAADETFYFKGEGDSILVSPAEADPVSPGDARPDQLSIAAAIERVNEVTSLGIRSISTAWAGLRTFLPDGLPAVGRLDDESFLWVVGQGGYGLQMAPALGRLAAAVFRNAPVPADIAESGVDAECISPRRLAVGGGRSVS